LPSKLLRLALRDFEACEREGRFLIDAEASIVFNPFDSGDPRIMVGVSGAFLIRRLGVNPVHDWSAPKCTGRFVDAVGWLSVGKVAHALDELGITHRPEEIPSELLHPAYSEAPTAYKASLQNLADCLASNGL